MPMVGVGLIARAFGLVVERHVAADDGRLERAAGVAEAADGLDELPHDLGALGVAEVEAVGDGERLGADGGDVAVGLGDGEARAFVGIERAEARVAVGGEREPLGVGRIGGAVEDADDGGVGAGAHDGAEAHHVIVLAVDPLLRRDVRRRRAA